jgi:hypothetical protein
MHLLTPAVSMQMVAIQIEKQASTIATMETGPAPKFIVILLLVTVMVAAATVGQAIGATTRENVSVLNI